MQCVFRGEVVAIGDVVGSPGIRLAAEIGHRAPGWHRQQAEGEQRSVRVEPELVLVRHGTRRIAVGGKHRVEGRAACGHRRAALFDRGRPRVDELVLRTGQAVALLRRQVLERVARERPRGIVDLVTPGVACEPHQRTAALGEIRAGGKAERIFIGVTLAGDAAHRVEFDALEIVTQLEIDDARERVGSVHRRGAARDDFDTVDQHRGYEVDVDDTRAVGGNHAPPVDQHQRRRGRKSAQGEVALPAVGRVVRRAAERRHELRQGIEHALHGDRRGLLEAGHVDGNDRARGGEVRSSDA